MKRLPLLLCLLAVVLAACDRTPDMVLGREPMARLLVDLELADAYSLERRLDGFSTDSGRLVLRSSVLAKHGVNEAVLDSSLRWYARHLPRYMAVLDRCDSMLADTMRRIDALTATDLAARSGDTASIWPLAPSAVFAATQASEFLTFEVPVDSTWERGDVVRLSLALHNNLSPLSAYLGVDYLNRQQTTEAVSSSLLAGDERHLELTLQLDSTMSARRVYGYLRLAPAKGERAFVNSIRLIRTRLLSENYNNLRYPQLRFTRNDD